MTSAQSGFNQRFNQSASQIMSFGGRPGYTRYSVDGPLVQHQAELRKRELADLDMQQRAFQQNQTNKQRLLDSILGGGGVGGTGSVSGSFGLGDYRERANALIDQMGGADRTRINRDFTAASEGALANLSDRGFGGSSLSQNISLGTEREKQQALTGVEQGILDDRLGVEGTYFDKQASLIQSLLGGIFN